MANTWSFFPDASTLIKAAMRRIRAYDPESATTITSVQYANALETLNFIMSSWQALGMQIWCRKTTSKALTASQGSYTAGTGGNIAVPRPLMIMQAWLRDTDGTDFPLEIIGRDEYNELSKKAQEGSPIKLYYDATYDGATNRGSTSTGTVYLWPEPDTTTAADKTLYISYQRPLEDFDTTADHIDMPQEWFNALRLTLAYSIAPEYGMPVIEYDRLKVEMDTAVELAKSWDTDFVPVKFAPEYRR